MQNIVLYKNAGNVLIAISDNGLTADNVAVIDVDVPEGYYVESINPETNEPILAPIPLTEEQQRLADLEAKMNTLLGTEGE